MTIKPSFHIAKISESAGVEMTNVGLIIIDDENIENKKMGEHLLKIMKLLRKYLRWEVH